MKECNKKENIRDHHNVMRILTAVATFFLLMGIFSVDSKAAKWGFDTKLVPDERSETGGMKEIGIYISKAGVEYYPIKTNTCNKYPIGWSDDTGYHELPHEHKLILEEFECGGQKIKLYECDYGVGVPNYNLELCYVAYIDIDTGEHQYTDTVYPPANGEKGYIHYKCTRCGYEYKFYYDGDSPNQEGTGDDTPTDPVTPGDGTNDDSSQTGYQNPTDDHSSPARISISQAKVTLKNNIYLYDGKLKKPQVKSVILGEKTLKKGSDYIVTYENNKKAGEARVIITGCGAYCDTCKKNFRIVKKGEKLTPSGSKEVYTVTGSNTVALKKSNSTGNIKIPSKITVKGNTFKVTSIAAGALKNNGKVTGVTIPATVTSIGNNAFYGTKINSVKIYGNLSSVGTKAFYNKGGKCTYTIYSTGKKKYNAIVKKIKASSNTKSKLTFKYKKK
jgi:hypothetical protein